MSRRRWLRYSIRTLLLAILTLSAWFAWTANRAAKQRRAVALVQKLGGRVVYGCQIVTAPPSKISPLAGADPPSMAAGPVKKIVSLPEGRLYDLLGIDWFHNVVQVRIFRGDVDDEELRLVLESLPHLEKMTTYNCSYTDEGLQHFAAHKNLRRLRIVGGVITPDGFAWLRKQRPDLEGIPQGR